MMAASDAEELLQPTNKHFEAHAVPWTFSRARNQVCRINCQSCSSSSVGWDPRNVNGIEHWVDRHSNCFTDAMLAFERDESSDAEDIPEEAKFPFMMALASPRSAMLKSMVSVSCR